MRISKDKGNKEVRIKRKVHKIKIKIDAANKWRKDIIYEGGR